MRLAEPVDTTRSIQYMNSVEVDSLACADPDAAAVDVLILPDGMNETSKGPFLVDADAFKMIEADKEKRGTDIVFDFEHQSAGGPYARADGKVPAAGWVKSLRYEKGVGIVALVEWTDEARALIQSKQYKYSSPFIDIDKRTKRVVKLISVAVTNRPATYGAQPLAAKDTHNSKGNDMGKMKLSEPKGGDLLGEVRMILQEMTPEDQAATVEKVVEEVDEVGALIAELRTALGMGEDAMPTDVLAAAIKNATPSEDADAEKDSAELKALKATICLKDKEIDTLQATKVDGVAFKEMAEEVKTLKAIEDGRNADASIETLVASGKLNPNDADRMKWANAMALKDPKNFKVLMDGAPVVMPADGQVVSDGGSPTGARAKTITLAAKEYDADPSLVQCGSKASYVTAVLRETDEADLTDAETKSLTAKE